MSALDQLDKGPIDVEATVRLGELPLGFSPERWANMSTLVGQVRLYAEAGDLAKLQECVAHYEAKDATLTSGQDQLRRSQLCQLCGGTGWEATQRLPEVFGGPGYVFRPCTKGCEMNGLPGSPEAASWADKRLPPEGA